MNFEFEVPSESKMIKVIGVGGGGSNAVNHMFNQGIKDVDFIVCNTDKQALLSSPVLHRLHIGTLITEGLGAGANAEIGKQSALESADEIKKVFTPNTKMVFITAGMGGGTGTGAAPVIAALAREAGILTVGIVTTPFTFEGKRRKEQADTGIEEMRNSVDALIVVKNDQLRYLFGNLSIKDAFSKADDILTIAAKGIAEIITVKGYVNVDFMDVKTVMKNSGVAIMGTGTAAGETRAVEAVKKALDCPLLSDNDIYGASNILLNISYGSVPLSMDENGEITDYITREIGLETENLIWGISEDLELGEALRVTLVATGFKKHEIQSTKKEVLNGLTQDSNFISSKKDDHLETKKSIKTEDKLPHLQEKITHFGFLNKKNDFLSEKNKKSEAVNIFSNSRFSFEVVEDFEDEEMSATDFSFANNQVEDAAEKKEDLKKEDLKKEEIVEKNSSIVFSFEQLEKERQIQQKNRLERVEKTVINRMKNGGLSDLEKEPAYLRRNIQLFDTPNVTEGSVLSRFSIENEFHRLENDPRKKNDTRSGLRANNSFLHDNVD